MYCILISGIPASGKSTLAKQLSRKMNLASISKDSMKELLFDRLGFESREEKVKLGTAATDLMYYVAGQMMQVRQPFILENNFEAATKEILAQMIKKYEYMPITVHLTGDYEKIYDRFIERDNSGQRHPGHITNQCYIPGQTITKQETPTTKEQFIASIKSRQMDEAVMEGPRIVVDTTEFQNIDVNDIRRRIIALTGDVR